MVMTSIPREGRVNRLSPSARDDDPLRNQLNDDPFEQINFKVPRGTKLRVKRLALDQGGINMMTLFMQMLDEYENGRRRPDVV
jgi:hypothetical protein